MKNFDISKSPKTFVFVAENDTFTIRCNRCNSVVLRELKVDGYPYQCLSCDENMFSIETHEGKVHTNDEFDRLCCDARDLLELDNN